MSKNNCTAQPASLSQALQSALFLKVSGIRLERHGPDAILLLMTLLQ